MPRAVIAPRRAIALLGTVVVTVAGATALTGAASAGDGKLRVKVVDIQEPPAFSTSKVKMRKNGYVKWLWRDAIQGHNVTLIRAPKGVKKGRFRSQTSADPSFRFRRKLKVPGKYHFICTIHPATMHMNVVVRR